MIVPSGNYRVKNACDCDCVYVCMQVYVKVCRCVGEWMHVTVCVNTM